MDNKLLITFFVFISGILTTLFIQSIIYPDQFYVAKLPDGSVYDGELVNQKFNGHGKLVWPNNDSYVGEFVDGQFHGKGKLTQQPDFTYEGDFKRGNLTGYGTLSYSSSHVYTGELKNGLMDGEGTLKNGVMTYKGEFRDNQFDGHGEAIYEYGNTYTGEFEKGDFINGAYSSKAGDKYQGEFKNWLYDGQGTLETADGDKYIGHFSVGSMTGEGEHYSKKGNYYKGQFEYGQYSGKGRSVLKNGDVYQGSFLYGAYSGEGKIEYARAIEGVTSRAGTWRYGKLIKSSDGNPIVSAKTQNEIALYNQNTLLAKSWADLKQGNNNEIDLYFLGISGDGTQSVFRREIQFVQSLFRDKFKTGGRDVVLINSQDTVKEIPLATETSIKQSIEKISHKMDVSQDILFIYMTSHGSKNATFSIKQSEMGLPDLSALSLAEILESTSIKWKVIVISACYSGKFIEPLKNENTLIITASDKDRKSFGCSEDAEFTYFGEAYFRHALDQTSDFVEAFELATSYVEAKEKRNNYKQSKPQIYKEGAIIEQLQKWRGGL